MLLNCWLLNCCDRNFYQVLVKLFQTTKPGRPWKDAELCSTLSARRVIASAQFLMTTLPLERTIQQGATPNFSENLLDSDDISIYGEMLNECLRSLTGAFLTACDAARLLKSKFDLAQTGSTVKERKQARLDRQEIQERYGWTANLVNSFSKVAESLSVVEDVQNLELLDINTLKSLCSDKFAPIVEQLKSDRLTVVEVRGQMTDINKALKEEQQSQPKPMKQWRRTKEGRRFLDLNGIDADTGDEFDAKYKYSCMPLPLFIRDLLRQWKPDTYVVRQMGEEDYVWVEGCKLLETPVPPVSLWYVFENKSGEKLRVAGDEEFQLMSKVSSLPSG